MYLSGFLRLLPIILLILLACSTAPQNETLLRVDSLMEDNPQLALEMLDSLDRTSPALSHADSSLRTLLVYEGRYKNDLPLSRDTSLAVAADYFRSSGDDHRLMRLLFVKSQTEFADRDLSASMNSAMDAEKAAKTLKDTLFLARISNHMSLLYQYSLNIPASLEKNREARELFRSIDRPLHYKYALVDEALDLHNLEKYSLGLALLDSLIPELSEPSHLLGYALETRLDIMMKLDSMDRVMSDYSRLKNLILSGDYNYNRLTALNVELALKNYQEAYRILQSVNLPDEFISRSDLEYSYYRYFKAIGKSDSALSHHETYVAITEPNTLALLNQNVSFTRGDWFKKESERHRDESARIKLILVGGSVIAILIILLLVIFYRLLQYRTNTKINNFMFEMSQLSSRLKSKEESLSSLERCLATDRTEHLKEKAGLMTELTTVRASLTDLQGVVSARDMEINDMKSTIADQNSAIAKYDTEIENLFSGRLKTIDQMCKAYFAIPNPASDKENRIIYKKVGEAVDDICAGIDISQVEEIVNKYSDNILRSFKEDFRKINKHTYGVVILTVAGLSSPVICRILKISIDNYYSYRKRLKEKINKSTCQNKMRYLMALDMIH